MDCLRTPFAKFANQCMVALCVERLRALRRFARDTVAHIWMGGPMAAYRPTEQRELSGAVPVLRRNRDRSVTCVGWPDANTVCASCAMRLVDPPFQARDYFDVIMRVGRPLRRAPRLRRAG